MSPKLRPWRPVLRDIVVDENITEHPDRFLSSVAVLDLIEKKCRVAFSDENDRQESFSYILEALENENYHRLRQYNGKSAPMTFINVLSSNLLLDFKRKKYGRKRYPKMIESMGEWAKAVYRYVCWQKFSYDDAFDFIKVEDLFAGSYEAYLGEVEKISTAPCNENPRFVTFELCHEGSDFKNGSNSLNPLDAMIEQMETTQRRSALKVLSSVTASLEETDRFIIDKVYGSDMKQNEIAKMLGLSPGRLRTRIKKILLQYKEALLAKGIRAS